MTETARALLLEDKDFIAVNIHELLAAQGFRVTACGPAWEHLRADQSSYHLTELGCGVPRLDGIDLPRRGNSDPNFARNPVKIETALRSARPAKFIIASACVPLSIC